MTILAVDLGGTRLKSAVLTGGVPGAVTAVVHGGDWLPALRTACSAAGATSLALCVPGVVDGGRVVSLPGKLPGIENADLTALLGLPVLLVVNDAIAYGVGAAVACSEHGRVVVVTLGTGVGCAVVEDGRPLGRGPFGGGLLGGQIVIGAQSGPIDTSGTRGTFEAHCRADSLVASVPGATDVASAYALVASGDPAAVQGFSDYRCWLVRGLAALCLAHAPDCVVVGGGAARPALLDGLEHDLRAHLWHGQSVVLRLDERGDAAALHGLGLLLEDR